MRKKIFRTVVGLLLLAILALFGVQTIMQSRKIGQLEKQLALVQRQVYVNECAIETETADRKYFRHLEGSNGGYVIQALTATEWIEWLKEPNFFTLEASMPLRGDVIYNMVLPYHINDDGTVNLDIFKLEPSTSLPDILQEISFSSITADKINELLPDDEDAFLIHFKNDITWLIDISMISFSYGDNLFAIYDDQLYTIKAQ